MRHRRRSLRLLAKAQLLEELWRQPLSRQALAPLRRRLRLQANHKCGRRPQPPLPRLARLQAQALRLALRRRLVSQRPEALCRLPVRL